jgi:hypothetical protein
VRLLRRRPFDRDAEGEARRRKDDQEHE